MLLKMKSDYSKLNKLVHDLLSIDPTRPEVFVALSVLWERKDERGALSYAEKVSWFICSSLFPLLNFFLLSHKIHLFFYNQSIKIDERHIPGYIVKVLKYVPSNKMGVYPH